MYECVNSNSYYIAISKVLHKDFQIYIYNIITIAILETQVLSSIKRGNFIVNSFIKIKYFSELSGFIVNFILFLYELSNVTHILSNTTFLQ